jgi:hypothetical protein
MEEIVHIVPLGWEFDRVVLPIARLRAHRVYLICDPTGHPKRAYYLRKSRAKLERDGIDVRTVQVDTFADLAGTMREVSRIVQLELNGGARVHVNISAAGRLGAVGATLAAMAHLKPGHGSIYYVPAIDYPVSEKEQRRHGMSRGMKGDPIDVPLFELGLPNLPARLILSNLLQGGSKRLKYSEARKLLAEHGIPGYEGKGESDTTRAERTRWNVNLYRRIVQPLVRQKLVEVEALGREYAIRLTRAGEYVACLSLLTEESSAIRGL